MNQNSLDAFRELKNRIGDRQLQMIFCLSNIGQATNTEISKRFEIPINQVTPRIFELRRMGIVYQVDDRPCSITKRQAAVWAVYSPKEAIFNFEKYLKNKESFQPKSVEVQKSFI